MLKNKKGFKLLSIIAIIWVAILGLVVKTETAQAYQPVRPDLPTPEVLGFPTEIPNVDMKTYDFSQTFNFPGTLGGSSYDGNHAYTSPGFDNIINLVNGRGTNSQKASVWYKQKLNLNTEFEFSYYTYVGQNNLNGNSLGIGDGMTLTFHNDPAGIGAIGGYGGGIGVYPIGNSNSDVNMIYNAVTVEMDTYENNSTQSPNYDNKLKALNPGGIIWPHAAISGTITPNTNIFGNAAIKDAYANNTHLAPTFATSRTQANNEWFSKWVKMHVKWVPDADGIHGTLSYEVNDYGMKSAKVNIDEYWNSNYNATTNARWDRKVVWGFTSSNHSSQRGNPVGILMDKLPYEPKVEVDRKVKNITANDADYQEATIAQAKPGDTLEYKVKVTNKTNDEWGVPFTGLSQKEELQTNSYVANSLKATTTVSGVTAPLTMGVNVTADNVLETNLGSKTLSKNGNSYEYTYQVIVGENTNKFVNDVLLTNLYGADTNYGETTVDIVPQSISIAKTSSINNPKVGEEVKLTLETKTESGRLVIDSIEDSVPAGFEVVPGSTYFYEKGTTGTKTPLSDSVWNNNSLTIDGADAFLNGGTVNNNVMVVDYTIRPLVATKGQDYVLPIATIKGHNEHINTGDGRTYQAESSTVPIKVKTDVTISFKNKSDSNNLIDVNKIISTNATFNKTNPVVIYLNTNDAYNYTDIIKEISTNLLANDKLTQVSITGDTESKGITAAGSVVDVFYSADVNMSIKQVYKEDNDVGIYADLENKTKVDNSEKFALLPGTNIVDVLNDLIAKKKLTLNYKGYKDIVVTGYKVLVGGTIVKTDVVPSSDFTIVLEYEGLIAFDGTANINFGKKAIDIDSTKTYSPTNSDTEVKIINTTLTKKWKLNLSLPEGFKGASGDDYLGEITYNETYVIGKDSLEIETQAATDLIKSIDMKGSSTNKGLLISQAIGNRAEAFSGKLLWSLEDTP